MKRKFYFVSLVSMIIGTLCCVVLLFNTAWSQPSPVIDEGFNYQKDWYSQSDAIMDYYNFPREIAWDDNILNPDNHEYLIETLFNIGIDNPLEMDCIELQYLFIERYLGTCNDISQEWYYWYKEYKRC